MCAIVVIKLVFHQGTESVQWNLTMVAERGSPLEDEERTQLGTIELDIKTGKEKNRKLI